MVEHEPAHQLLLLLRAVRLLGQLSMRGAGQPSASARGPRVENRLDHRRLRPFLEPGAIVDRVKALSERDDVDEQFRALMQRYVLDHELLQQATSADYSEGDSSLGDRNAA